jgi:hypothetical protein
VSGRTGGPAREIQPGVIRAFLMTYGRPLPFDPQSVDGSGLARTFFHVCSIGPCAHVLGHLARFT